MRFMVRLIGWVVRSMTALRSKLKGELLGGRRGQASAIGAVFFILILGIVLGYMFNFINQVEELNRAALSTMQTRFERQREALQIALVDYVETGLVDYDPESVEIVYGTKVQDSPLTIEAAVSGGGVSNVTLIDEDFEEDGWEFEVADDLACPSWWDTCVFDGVYEDVGDWGDVSGYAVGAESGVYIISKNRFKESAKGYYLLEFSGGNFLSVNLSLDYLFEPLGFSARGKVTWILSVSINRSDDMTAVWGPVEVLSVVDDGSVSSLHGSWEPSSEIPADVFEAGKQYYLVLYVEVQYNLRKRPGSAIYYYAKAFFDNVHLEATVSGGGGGGGFAAWAGAAFSFDVGSGVPAVLMAEVEVDSVPVEISLYYEDPDVAGVWERVQSFTVRTTDVVLLNASLVGEASEASRFMLVASAGTGFTLTVYGFWVNCSFVAENFNVTVLNEGGETVKVVSVWVVNSTNVWRSDLNVVLAPLEEETVRVDYGLVRGSRYLVRIVTEKGNIFDYYLAIP